MADAQPQAARPRCPLWNHRYTRRISVFAFCGLGCSWRGTPWIRPC